MAFDGLELPPEPAARYADIRPLGRGGMGETWRARDLKFRRDVVLKTLRTDRAEDEPLRRRFEREVRALARVTHPNVVRILDCFDAPCGLVYVMDFVNGEPLRDRFRRGELSSEELLLLVAGVASGLAAVHGAGLLHRDLKPENVMVDDEGKAVIIDFGLVGCLQGMAGEASFERITKTGQVMGTLGYLPPEVLLRRPHDERSDVFQAGVILYEGLVGRLPYDSAAVMGLASGRPVALPTPPSARRAGLGPELDRLVLAAVAVAPEERPPSATALATACRALAEGGRLADEAVPPVAPSTRSRSRMPRGGTGIPGGASAQTMSQRFILGAKAWWVLPRWGRALSGILTLVLVGILGHAVLAHLGYEVGWGGLKRAEGPAVRVVGAGGAGEADVAGVADVAHLDVGVVRRARAALLAWLVRRVREARLLRAQLSPGSMTESDAVERLRILRERNEVLSRVMVASPLPGGVEPPSMEVAAGPVFSGTNPFGTSEAAEPAPRGLVDEALTVVGAALKLRGASFWEEARVEGAEPWETIRAFDSLAGCLGAGLRAQDRCGIVVEYSPEPQPPAWVPPNTRLGRDTLAPQMLPPGSRGSLVLVDSGITTWEREALDRARWELAWVGLECTSESSAVFELGVPPERGSAPEGHAYRLRFTVAGADPCGRVAVRGDDRAFGTVYFPLPSHTAGFRAAGQRLRATVTMTLPGLVPTGRTLRVSLSYSSVAPETGAPMAVEVAPVKLWRE